MKRVQPGWVSTWFACFLSEVPEVSFGFWLTGVAGGWCASVSGRSKAGVAGGADG